MTHKEWKARIEHEAEEYSDPEEDDVQPSLADDKHSVAALRTHPANS